MTQYNTLNLKLFNSQYNKLKSGIKNDTQEIFHHILSAMMILIFHREKNQSGQKFSEIQHIFSLWA